MTYRSGIVFERYCWQQNAHGTSNVLGACDCLRRLRARDRFSVSRAARLQSIAVQAAQILYR